MAFKVTEITFPGFTANCFLVSDENTKEAFLLDPGAYGKRQSEYIKSQGVNLRYILLTHGHYDHILGVKQFSEDFPEAKVVIHCEDEPCLKSPVKSLAIAQGLGFPKAEADIIVGDGDILVFAEDQIEVIHTPGHTKGSVCYKLGDMLFTGDTLFRGTVGRTDFPGGSYKEIISSVEKLGRLGEDYKVYPGHEGTTTLENERRNNPYMRGM